MTVDERARQRLYRRLEEVLGESEATALMERLPPEGYADLVTKGDLAVTREELRREMGEVRVEIAELRAEMHRAFRAQTITLTTLFAVINGVIYTALKLG